MAILPFRKKKDQKSGNQVRNKSDRYQEVLERAVKRNKEYKASESIASKRFKKRLEERIKK